MLLQGIGVATASAILAACDHSVPFMSDEALAAVARPPYKYSMAEYLDLLPKLRDKAAELTGQDTAGTE